MSTATRTLLEDHRTREQASLEGTRQTTVPMVARPTVAPADVARRRVVGGATGAVTGPGADGAGPSRGTFLRRRLAAVAVLLVVGFLLTAVIGRVSASADLEDPVAGHVVVEPGETLWDVAVATAPDGVDTRQQLADLRDLNGIDGTIEAWTTVLIPAR